MVIMSDPWAYFPISYGRISKKTKGENRMWTVPSDGLNGFICKSRMKGRGAEHDPPGENIHEVSADGCFWENILLEPGKKKVDKESKSSQPLYPTYCG